LVRGGCAVDSNGTSWETSSEVLADRPVKVLISQTGVAPPPSVAAQWGTCECGIDNGRAAVLEDFAVSGTIFVLIVDR